jgi:hypothetical protein
MSNMTDEDAAIFLSNQTGELIQIGTVKHGVTMHLFKSTRMKVCKVSFQNEGKTDEFFFDGDTPVFHHIMTDLPPLRWVYLQYFSQEESYSPSGLLTFVIKHYFSQELNSVLP